MAEENDKWGSGKGKGEAKGVEESGRRDEPEGADREMWGGKTGERWKGYGWNLGKNGLD